jgi:hypothetical protein
LDVAEMKNQSSLFPGIAIGIALLLIGTSGIVNANPIIYETDNPDLNFFLNPSINTGFTSRDNPETNWNVEYVGSCDITMNALRAFVQGEYAYVISTDYPEQPDSTLSIVSITDPAHPQVVGTVSGFHIVFDLFVHGEYAYITDFYATPGFPSYLYQVDISNPAHPVVTFNANSSGNARAVFCQDNYAYLAAFGAGLEIYSISDPGLTRQSKTYTNAVANEVCARGNYAYISDTSLEGDLDLLSIYNVSVPTHPVQTGRCKFPLGYDHIALGVALKDNYAFAADIAGLTIFNITDPAEPTVLTEYDHPNWCGDVEIDGNYAYLATDEGVEVVNISDPAHPFLVGHYAVSGVSDLDVKDNLIYAAGWDNDLQIFRFTEQPAGWPNQPATPTGPTQGSRDVEYEFSTNTTDPQADQVYYQWHWSDGTQSEWEGPYNSGEIATARHTWTIPGNIGVQVQAKNTQGLISDWSEPHIITIMNHPPETPQTPSGPTEGNIGADYTFSTSTTDPEEDQVSYQWDWGDGDISEWTDLSESGETVSSSHRWVKPGDYDICVKAKDEFGNVSSWSEPLTIAIHGPALEITTIQSGIFHLFAIGEIKNVGDREATNVNYTISLNGGIIFFPKDDYKRGTIDRIGVDESVSVRTFVFGFFKTDITVKAEIQNVPPTRMTVPAFLLGPLVLIQ